jgi:hypothetical protein
MAFPSLRGIGTSWDTGYMGARRALIPDQSRLVSGGLSPNHLTISALQRRLNISEDLDFSENNSGIIDQSPILFRTAGASRFFILSQSGERRSGSASRGASTMPSYR